MTRLVVLSLSLGALLACGGDENTPDAATGGPDAPGAPDSAGAIDAALPGPDADTSGFVLTSPEIADGGMFGLDHSCYGDDVSPELAWTAWSGAASYAVVLIDDTIDYLHSAIYDIDPATLSLPAAIAKVYEPAAVPGARQSVAWDSTLGYAGPCPGNTHQYSLVLYALDVATIPGTDARSSVGQVEDLLEQHKLATTRLTATFSPPL